MPKLVLCETDLKGDPIRILRFRKEALQLPVESVIELPKADAVRKIRLAIWERSKDDRGVSHCEWCGAFLTWKTGHMHEQIHRGRGGEVSVENSVFICPNCHLNVAHADRRWQTAKLREPND